MIMLGYCMIFILVSFCVQKGFFQSVGPDKNDSLATSTKCKSIYVGCFQFADSDMTKNVATLSDCTEFCKNYTFNLIAIKGGDECGCAHHVAYALPSFLCDTYCSDNCSCGAKHFYSVYKGKPQIMHQAIMPSDFPTGNEHVLHFKVPYTLQMCAEFCLEINQSSFQNMDMNSDLCHCLKNLHSYQFEVDERLKNRKIKCFKCPNNIDEVCKCHFEEHEDKDILYISHHLYEFQRGISSYSHCSKKKFELVSECIEGCDKGWKGDSCRERDCDKNNGDCGSEMKCIVLTVNDNKYTECVCPHGTVRNKYYSCEVFRTNLALHKPAYTSSMFITYWSADSATDGRLDIMKFAHLNDFTGSWIAVDLEKLYCIGIVMVYNRIVTYNSIIMRANNFWAKLNKTFDVTNSNRDIRNEVNECGMYPGVGINEVNPMIVMCKHFTLLSRFVIVQHNDKHWEGNLAINELEAYSVDCHMDNGHCGENRCKEVPLNDVTVIKCDEWKGNITVNSEMILADSVYGCIKKVDYAYKHNETGLSYSQCTDVCISKSYDLSTVKAGIKCYCGNELTLTEEVSIFECYVGHFDSYLVYKGYPSLIPTEALPTFKMSISLLIYAVVLLLLLCCVLCCILRCVCAKEQRVTVVDEVKAEDSESTTGDLSEDS